jgi:hypothetical protein
MYFWVYQNVHPSVGSTCIALQRRALSGLQFPLDPEPSCTPALTGSRSSSAACSPPR